ncbi:MAG: hypothetical protein JO096_11130 [Alphaproteobacteria bacterium]|nr:hypothetical protein [Alphaproteobacteria bacterium]
MAWQLKLREDLRSGALIIVERDYSAIFRVEIRLEIGRQSTQGGSCNR